jgi:hypothetical protein
MAQPATQTVREAAKTNLAATAHVLQSYPRRAEDIAAVVVEVLEQESFGGRASSVDDAITRSVDIMRKVAANPRLKHIIEQLASEYDPPPFTSLPDEAGTEGEPIELAIAVGLGLAWGIPVGMAWPL